MRPGDVAERLRACPLLLVPVGGTTAQGAQLPLGTDTLLIERVADDVSRARGIVRAPAFEYGVHRRDRARDGGVALRRKTLHRMINEVIDSWETGAGVRHFVLLTALANDAHLEALSTVRVEHADVTTVDIFGLDFGDRLRASSPEARVQELVTSLMMFLHPELVPAPPAPASVANVDDAASNASPATGQRVYGFMLERILHLVDAILAGR